uniref:Reverse transcriptase domain-containing protein n=1 Tax=Tanacetum cinerariifolium TaxID=118510 RepID=A0A6L2KX01_TANCI|nr:reverse transcriptase domain-containing protein [Tanacetum cinerariifolium]
MLRVFPHHGISQLTQIDMFYNGLNEQDQDSLNVTAGGNLLSKTTREALKLIENKSKVCYSRSKLNVSRVNMNSRDSSSKSDDRIDKLADQISNLVEIVNKQVITPATAKATEKTYVIDVGTIPSNIVPNPKGEMKPITTRSGLAYKGPSIPTNSPLENVVERDTKETTDKKHSNCQGSTVHIQTQVVPISILEPDVPKTQPKPNIPYPSRLNDQKLQEKDTNQMEMFFQIFHDLHFDISFADALLLMPKFASTIKSLLMNKDKLFEFAKVPLNENSSAMLLKKLLKKYGDPGKFLITCDFLAIDVCHALVDLGASIILMPLSIRKKLSLPELTPTRMTLELPDRSITRPKGVAEDVFIKMGKFYFPTDFVVVDFEADPRVPLILGEIFLEKWSCLNRCGDILYLEKLLNEGPFQLLPMDLKQAEDTKAKSLIEEPPELELKELPSHLEYSFLEDTDKLAHKSMYLWPIHYASKTMTEAQIHYTMTEKEMLAVVYAFEKFRPYLVLSKTIVFTDHSAFKYLLNKQDAKPRFLRWVLLLTFHHSQVFPYGTVELSQLNGPNYKVNGHRVKHYFEGDIPSKVVPDLHTFPMDK